MQKLQMKIIHGFPQTPRKIIHQYYTQTTYNARQPLPATGAFRIPNLLSAVVNF